MVAEIVETPGLWRYPPISRGRHGAVTYRGAVNGERTYSLLRTEPSCAGMPNVFVLPACGADMYFPNGSATSDLLMTWLCEGRGEGSDESCSAQRSSSNATAEACEERFHGLKIGAPESGFFQNGR